MVVTTLKTYAHLSLHCARHISVHIMYSTTSVRASDPKKVSLSSWRSSTGKLERARTLRIHQSQGHATIGRR